MVTIFINIMHFLSCIYKDNDIMHFLSSFAFPFNEWDFLLKKIVTLDWQLFMLQAGLVTTLSTRTIVFGATNPKGQYDPSQRISFIWRIPTTVILRSIVKCVIFDQLWIVLYSSVNYNYLNLLDGALLELVAPMVTNRC